MSDSSQYQRRFGGTQTLYGDSAFKAYEQAHVYVIGVGGVGSWAAEGLARTAVGTITLVDLDVLVASNVNRQLPALDAQFGQSKIAAMAERIKQINPRVQLNLVDDFLTADNIHELLPDRQALKQAQQNGQQIVILDCIDDMSAKIALALDCALAVFAAVFGRNAWDDNRSRYGLDAADLGSVYTCHHCSIWLGAAVLQKCLGVN